MRVACHNFPIALKLSRRADGEEPRCRGYMDEGVPPATEPVLGALLCSAVMDQWQKGRPHLPLCHLSNQD